MRKWEANGEPKILKNPPKSSKVLPKVPSGEVFGAASGKTAKINDFGVPQHLENVNIATERHQIAPFPSDLETVPKISPKSAIFSD